MATNSHDNKSGPVSLADEEAVKQVLVNTVFGHLSGPGDMAIPRCVKTADEAIALLREHHAKWLSEKT